MFGLFASQERKLRDAASKWLELSRHVWHYRRDRLTAAESADLIGREEHLRRELRERADAGRLKLSIEALEDVLRRTGGAIYPKTSLAENVDFFLVAAIVILGIRAYFVQPFKIPTNSMWPTYYGMTAENFPPGQPVPGWADRLFRLAAFGAQRQEVIAPRTGDVTVPFIVNGNTLTDYVAFNVKPGRKWLVIPTPVAEYTFDVGGAPASLQLPVDFHEFDGVVIQTLFGGLDALHRREAELNKAGLLKPSIISFSDGTQSYERMVVNIPVGKAVQAGEPLLRFDLMTGDQLFVDRISYQFMRPEVGQGFVFRTNLIPGIGKDDYFIKRLVGTPGDVLEVKEPALYRNGRPIMGAAAFNFNATRTFPYTGYCYGDALPDGRYLSKGQTLTVPAGYYFAMGDNSIDSSDSRVWGFVPSAAVIGRPLFIYYPFTKRWGPAR